MLNNLEAGTTYYVMCEIITSSGDVIRSEIKKVRTAPAAHKENYQDHITFAVASDIGKNEIQTTMSQHISKTSPLFIAIGGDVVYENGYPTCNYLFILNWFFSK